MAAEHGGCGGRLPSDPLPVGHDQQVVDGLKQVGIAPEAEPAEDGALGRQIGGQQPPSNAAAQHIEDRVRISSRPAPGSSAGARRGQERPDQRPFGIGQIDLVAQAVAAIRQRSGGGLRRGFKSGFGTLLEPRLPTTQPFSGQALTGWRCSPRRQHRCNLCNDAGRSLKCQLQSQSVIWYICYKPEP